jgi:hypothetical protein
MHHVPLVRMFRAAQVAFVTAAMLLIATSGVSAATTLAGETFVNEFDNFSTNGTCNASGASTFTFSASGPTAPNIGRYNESGTFTIASPTGPLTSFSASFTVTAAGVTGTKTLGVPTAAGCTPGGFFSDVHFLSSTNYQVTAPFTESGTASMVLDFRYPGTFTEGPFVAGPVAPTTKQDCMNGGYANFTDPTTGAPFKNQGQCIKFVNHEA